MSFLLGVVMLWAPLEPCGHRDGQDSSFLNKQAFGPFEEALLQRLVYRHGGGPNMNTVQGLRRRTLHPKIGSIIVAAIGPTTTASAAAAATTTPSLQT